MMTGLPRWQVERVGPVEKVARAESKGTSAAGGEVERTGGTGAGLSGGGSSGSHRC